MYPTVTVVETTNLQHQLPFLIDNRILADTKDGNVESKKLLHSKIFLYI